MNRRNFLSLLAGLPIVGRWMPVVPQPMAPWRCHHGQILYWAEAESVFTHFCQLCADEIYSVHLMPADVWAQSRLSSRGFQIPDMEGEC